MSEESNEIYALAAKVAKDAPQPDNPSYGREDVMISRIQYFPLREAYLCGSCEMVSNSPALCPNCASNIHQLPLVKYVQPTLEAEESSNLL